MFSAIWVGNINTSREPSELQKDGKTITYTPDFYLPEQDTFYEIKGWMDQASAEKIALFRTQYPEKSWW